MTGYPIYPSLLAFDLARLTEQVAAVEAAGAAGLHLDVMDGQFVPNLTFGPLLVEAIRPHTHLPIWAHLMTYTPEALIAPLTAAGATRIYAHPEATPHIHRVLGAIRAAGVEAGVAINPGTPVSLLEPLLDLTDGILLMSVNPGFGGQRFIPSTYARLRQLTALLATTGHTPTIECDGGVDAGNLAALCTAGMTGAVVGTALFHEGDPGMMLRRMQAEAVAH